MQEYITNVLTIIFIVSIPIYFLYPAITLVFWGHSLKQHWKKLLLFALLEPFYINWFIFSLSLPVYILNSTISYFLLFFFIFRNLNALTRFKIIFFSFFILMVMDMATGMVVSQFFSRGELLSNPALLALSTWPVYFILLGILYFMHTYQWSPGVRIMEYIKSLKSKHIIYLLLFLFVQFVVLTLSIGSLYEINKGFDLIDYLLFTALVLSFVIIIITLRVISQTKDDAVRLTQQVYIEDVNQMFTTIRGQRHDFLNHVQVISSFIKRGKIKELEQYTQELIGEIQEINEYIQIGHPALSALIQSKVVIAMDQKIDLRYKFSNMDQLSLGMKSIDIVKIMANLIDNAFDEVIHLAADNKWVELNCWVEQGSFYLTVQNPGRHMTEDELNLIFASGYTTKTANNHMGIGLSVVKERVEYYKGKIKVDSCPAQGTQFHIEIPLGAKLI